MTFDIKTVFIIDFIDRIQSDSEVCTTTARQQNNQVSTINLFSLVQVPKVYFIKKQDNTR